MRVGGLAGNATMKSPRLNWKRIACLVTFLGIGQFVAGGAIAIGLHPGGNPFKADAKGYAFWSNTLSDLGRARTVSGQANPIGSAVFKSSMVAWAASLVPMWLVVPLLFPTKRKTGLWVRLLGPAGMAALIAVTLMPADAYYHGHMIGNGLLAGTALPALALCCLGMVLDAACPGYLTGLMFLLLGLGGVHFVQYAHHFWFHGPWTQAAPAVQKVLTLSAMLWIVLAAVRIYRRA